MYLCLIGFASFVQNSLLLIINASYINVIKQYINKIYIFPILIRHVNGQNVLLRLLRQNF